jgi:hypothetical protein
MSVAEVIQKTIDNIQTRGWCQNSLYTQAGEVCMRGALYLATGSELVQNGDRLVMNPGKWSNDYSYAETLIRDIIWREAKVNNIPEYNDNVAKSEEDVLLILKKALDAAPKE